MQNEKEKEKIKEDKKINEIKNERIKIPIPKYNSFNNNKQSKEKKLTDNI